VQINGRKYSCAIPFFGDFAKKNIPFFGDIFETVSPKKRI